MCDRDFNPSFAELKVPDGTAFNDEKIFKLYYLNNVNSNKKSHSLQVWHKILSHCDKSDVLNLESVVDGMRIKNKSDFDCSACMSGKMPQYRNRDADRHATYPLELVFCDLTEPVSPAAKEDFKYAISFVDNFSGVICVYFLKSKGDTVRATEKFLADTAPYGNVKRFRCDNVTELTSEDFMSLLIKNRINQEFFSPYSPHQNGTVERSCRTLFDMARCLLLEPKLPKYLWTYALKDASYIQNRCYSPRRVRPRMK